MYRFETFFVLAMNCSLLKLQEEKLAKKQCLTISTKVFSNSKLVLCAGMCCYSLFLFYLQEEKLSKKQCSMMNTEVFINAKSPLLIGVFNMLHT